MFYCSHGYEFPVISVSFVFQVKNTIFPLENNLRLHFLSETHV